MSPSRRLRLTHTHYEWAHRSVGTVLGFVAVRTFGPEDGTVRDLLAEAIFAEVIWRIVMQLLGLVEERREARSSQCQLGAGLGKSMVTYRAIENGLAAPTIL